MNGWLADLFSMVLVASWRGSWLILAFMVLRLIGRKDISSRILFWGWMLIAFRLLLPLGFSTPWSPYNLTRPVVFHLDSQNDAPRVHSSVQVRSPKAQVGIRSPNDRLLSPELVLSPKSYPRTLLAWLWLGGLAISLGSRVVLSFVFRNKLRGFGVSSDPRLTAAMETCARQLRLKRLPALIVTSLVNAPAIYGAMRAHILFPLGFAEKLTDAELRLVLLHELGHWRRRDLLVHALLAAARWVHWFNPLVWLACRLARLDCELACDEFVLSRSVPADGATYGATLLKVVGVAGGPPRSSIALGILENKRQLKQRIQMIVHYKTTTFAGRAAGVALLAVLSIFSLTHETRAQNASDSSTESAITTQPPKGWFQNGDKKDSYVVGVDRTVSFKASSSAYIKSIDAAITGFGGMMQTCSPENYIGKRVRFSAWIKTDHVQRSANIWFRVDGRGLSHGSLQFDNLGARAPKGTTDWTYYSVVLDVPAEASGLFYGFFVSGTGAAWYNDARFEEVGKDVPNTAMTVDSPSRKAPENLGFK